MEILGQAGQVQPDYAGEIRRYIRTEHEGVVDTISDKSWNKVVLWSFKLEGESRWYRTAKTEPATADGVTLEKGMKVKFEEHNLQVVLSSVQKLDEQVDAPPPSLPDVHTVTETVSTPPVRDIGKRIQWQAARRDACNVIVAALAADALPWNVNLAKGKRLDMLRGYIGELTTQFLEEEDKV
jgi:hypothetical protein